jgi:hypothetical protein
MTLKEIQCRLRLPERPKRQSLSSDLPKRSGDILPQTACPQACLAATVLDAAFERREVWPLASALARRHRIYRLENQRLSRVLSNYRSLKMPVRSSKNDPPSVQKKLTTFRAVAFSPLLPPFPPVPPRKCPSVRICTLLCGCRRKKIRPKIGRSTFRRLVKR